MKNYRKLFKKHYGVEFNSNYDIHHIDLNHENNNIDNLMILPKELHYKYHRFLSECNRTGGISTEIKGNGLNSENYSLDVAEAMIRTIRECNRWYDYKLYLEGKVPNIHNITLEV